MRKLEQWQEVPSGVDLRRRGRILRQAEQLKQLLEQLSRVSASDLKTLEEAQPVMKGLEARIHQLLETPADVTNLQENPMESSFDSPLSSSESILRNVPLSSTSTANEIGFLFEQGMEAWDEGDRRGACGHFRRLLKNDPHNAEALNYLGIGALERRQIKKA